MSDREISALRDENIKLKADIEELHKMLADHRNLAYRYFDLFTEHICDIHDGLADIVNYLMPLLYKVDPDVAETRRQIDQVLARTRRHGFDPDKKSD